MDEIRALQQELAAIQQTSVTQRLSDRNCIELVMKLQSLKLVDLIFTRTGKEYLTAHQLILEIQDEILTRGGRANLTDLPDALNVSLSHIESALPKVTADPSIQVIRGELITDYYLSSLIDEINDTLAVSQSGLDTLANIAMRYSLPVDTIRTLLNSHIDRLHAIFDSELMTITSDSALLRQKAEACGLLRGIIFPTFLSDIAAAHNLPVGIVNKTVREMLDKGAIEGRLGGHGSRLTYTPVVYITVVSQTLSAEFTANGFLHLDTLARLHVYDVVGFANTYLSSSILLSESILSSALIEMLSTSAMEAINSGSWIDVISALPAGFPENDMTSVVSQITGRLIHESMDDIHDSLDDEKRVRKAESPGRKTRVKQKNRKKDIDKAGKYDIFKQETLVFGSRYIVSPNLLANINRVVVAESEKRATDRAKKLAEHMELVGATTDSLQDGTLSKDGSLPTVSIRKGKSKSRRKAKGKDKGKEETDRSRNSVVIGDEVIPVLVPSPDDVIQLVVADEECGRLAERDYMDSGFDGNDMVLHVVTKAFSETKLQELFHQRAAEAIVELERERAALKANAERSLIEDLCKLEVYVRMGQTLDDILSKLSFQFLLDSLATKIVCQITEMVGRNCGVEVFDTAKITTLEKRKQIDFVREVARQLPPALQTKVLDFTRLIALKDANDCDVEEVLNVYDLASGVLDLPERRSVDKKAERALLTNLRCQTMDALDDIVSSNLQFSASESPRKILLKLSTVLTYARLHGGALIEFDVDDASAFSKAIECEQLGGKNKIIAERLAGVRVALLGNNVNSEAIAPVATDGHEEWGVALQRVLSLKELIE